MKGRAINLGHMAYKPTWELQKRAAREVITGGPDTLLFVEHDRVITLGASFQPENLLLTEQQLSEKGVETVRTDRGGDVTYHGPKQLVVYPIFDIGRHGRDLHKWLRDLEAVIMKTVAHYGLEGERKPDINTGVFVNGSKIAAIGVKVRKWVNLHGIAMNCNNDLKEFGYINPCGITTHGVTSLTLETGREITIEDARPVVKSAFEEVFGIELDDVEMSELLTQHDA